MQTIYIGNTLVNDVMLGSKRMDIPFERKIPTQSLLAWFDGTYYNNTDSWYSVKGNATASLSGSVLPQWKAEYGGIFNYTTASISVITSSLSNLINVLTSSATANGTDFTIFVTTRYSGSSTDHHGRTLSAQNGNFLFPTYGGSAGAGTTEYKNALWPHNGVVGGFTIQSGSIYDTEWRCHTAVIERPATTATSSYYLNGQFVTSSLTTNVVGPTDFGVNRNFGNFNEQNQMDIADIIIYSRALSASEITDIFNTIGPRVGL